MTFSEWDHEAVHDRRAGSRRAAQIARENLAVAHHSLTEAKAAARRYDSLLKSDSQRCVHVDGSKGLVPERPTRYERKREFEVQLRHIPATAIIGDQGRAFRTIVSADDLSDAWKEANLVVQRLIGRFRIIGLAMLDGRTSA
jgi:hypothetical protein